MAGQPPAAEVALVTDGRMSGASGKVPAAIHVSPEAAAGGPLAKVRDGDVVRMDALTGELNVLISDAEWAARVPDVMPQDLRDETVRVLQRKGVDVMLNTQVMDCDENGLTLKDGTLIPTKTVIWAAGVKAVPFIAELGFETDRAGRVIVNEKLQVNGHPDIFAIGDCANFQHGTERPLPTVAPVATQQAVVCFENVKKLMHGQNDLATFTYKDLGAMATIGRGDAVMCKGGMKMKGFFAWSAWLIVHLMRLAGAHTNITVSLKWMWNFLSGTRLGRIITNIELN